MTTTMKKPTIKDKILTILRRDGSIDNFYCIDSRLTTRLGAFIHKLKEEGLIDLDEEKSGYIENTKNYRYYIKNKPKEIIEYRVNGVVVSTKIVW